MDNEINLNDLDGKTDRELILMVIQLLAVSNGSPSVLSRLAKLESLANALKWLALVMGGLVTTYFFGLLTK